jgi:hypothetical protein
MFLGAIPTDAACGQPITVHVSTVVGAYSFKSFVDVVPGLNTLLSEDFEGTAPDWVALGDAPNGWQLGVPQQSTSRYGWIYQPQGGSRGSNQAWFTGLQPSHKGTTDSGLGKGTAVLYSPVIPLGSLYQPELHFDAWYEAIDFSSPMGGQVLADSALLVEGSADGGQTWVALDMVGGAEPSWQKRVVKLSDKLTLGATLALRFIVKNDDPSVHTIEAGIDHVELTTLTDACNPLRSADITPLPRDAAASGCAFMPTGPTGAALLLCLVVCVSCRCRKSRAERRKSP